MDRQAGRQAVHASTSQLISLMWISKPRTTKYHNSFRRVYLQFSPPQSTEYTTEHIQLLPLNQSLRRLPPIHSRIPHIIPPGLVRLVRQSLHLLVPAMLEQILLRRLRRLGRLRARQRLSGSQPPVVRACGRRQGVQQLDLVADGIALVEAG